MPAIPNSADQIPPGYTLRLGPWDALRDGARAVRTAVFIEEQQIPIALEWDDADAECWHALAFDASGLPVATGRLLPDGHLGRMAVLARCRGSGIGSAVLCALLEKAWALGYPEIVLHAQISAAGFYLRHGFTAVGEDFEEAGIPHRTMRLSNPGSNPGFQPRPGTTADSAN